MRSAQLVGLTPNGKYVIVATDTGEELAIAADDRLRAALRGDRPRLGMLEIEMESALTPREIQTRIRAGEDAADVARISGMGLDRVERFAAPVLAERDHIARQAMSSTVRRRGETSAHRNLRSVVTERLQGRGIEVSGLAWDSFRQSDGRWVVTATYSSGEAERQAQFSFDPLGRFSVAGNDEAHWMLGDSSSSKGPQPGRRRATAGESTDDTEPTLDLSDELALVRVVQDASDEDTESDTESDADTEDGADDDEAGKPDTETDDEVSSRAPQSTSQLEETIPIPSLRVVAGGWEPPIVVNYPVEPGPAEDASDEPGRSDAPTDIEDRRDEEDEFEAEHQATATSEPTAPEPTVPEPTVPESSEPPAPEAEVEPQKPSRRKRASVPSWDEIMFGGPK